MISRLDAADFVDTLTVARCWDLANALDELGSAFDILDATPGRDHRIAAAKSRLAELLANEETTQPLGTVRPR